MTWIVAKINRTQENIFKRSIQEKFKNEFELFYPKILKGKSKEYVNLLGDYVFLNIKTNSLILKEKYLKGLKYFLNNFNLDQKNIETFINYCTENSENHIINLKFFNNLKFSKIKFNSGPFKNFLFDIFWKNKKLLAVYRNISIQITKENNKNFIFV